MKTAILLCAICLSPAVAGADRFTPAKGKESKSFHWPPGKRGAVSLSFDDARLSQMDAGLAFLQKQGVKVTFFVQPEGVRKRLPQWKRAVADGHEIGSHTLTHPCTGNYEFSLNNALENYTLAMIAYQLDETNREVKQLLGVTPMTFAYPCGQKFVGRGLNSRSYVPLVAKRFIVGRGYLDESPNNPAFCDLSRAMGTSFDGTDFPQMKKVVDDAMTDGRWVIFVGHEMGKKGFQITDLDALKSLCDYMKDPSRGVWLGTVKEIGSYIQKQRARTD